eukprot:GHVU01028741.1.p1 GENE.GHVU01028741.1~~GHVU01028741.1.p1  ORF type:complete len:493 (+),score=32.08 GHVU01028741.1:158-1480(+)
MTTQPIGNPSSENIVTYYSKDLRVVDRSSSDPPSHQKVYCPVPGCTETPRRSDAPRHIERGHDNTYRFCDEDATKPNLLQFFGRTTTSPKRRRVDVDENLEEDHEQEQEEEEEEEVAAASSAGEGESEVREVPGPPNPWNAAVADAAQAVEGVQVAATAASPPSTGSGPETGWNPFSRLWTWFAKIHAMLVSLPREVARVIREEADQSAREQRRSQAIATVRGETLKDIAAANSMTWVEGGETMRCTPCAKWGPLHRTPNDRSINGVFSTTQQICELRRALAKHFAKPGHRTCVEMEARSKATEAIRRQQGMTNGRAVYSVIAEAGSYVSYERRMLLMHVNGVNVGTRNHSREFCRKFACALRDVMQESIADYVDTPNPVIGGRKPAVALAADKVTRHRRTSQVVSGTLLIEGELRCLLIGKHSVGTPRVSRHSRCQFIH